MEFSKSELTKAVFYILTLYPNKKFSPNEMFEYMKTENVCPELTQNCTTRLTRSIIINNISNALQDASNKYENVVYTNHCYLNQPTYKNLNNGIEIKFDSDENLHITLLNDMLNEEDSENDKDTKNNVDTEDDDVVKLKKTLTIVSRKNKELADFSFDLAFDLGELTEHSNDLEKKLRNREFVIIWLTLLLLIINGIIFVVHGYY